MSIFRMGHDEWGRVTVDGLSWDLLTLAFWGAVAVIVAHAIVYALTAGRRRRRD